MSDGYVCAHSLRGGATKFDGTTFTTETKKDGLNGDNVYCIMEDKAGNI